jgi:hypothetical protein
METFLSQSLDWTLDGSRTNVCRSGVKNLVTYDRCTEDFSPVARMVW